MEGGGLAIIFPVISQTIIIAQILSNGGKGDCYLNSTLSAYIGRFQFCVVNKLGFWFGVDDVVGCSSWLIDAHKCQCSFSQ